MKLNNIFNKNWNQIFCFFCSSYEIDAVFYLVNFDLRKIKIKNHYQWFDNSENGFGEEDFIKILSQIVKKIPKKSLMLIYFKQPFAKSTKFRFSVIRDDPFTPINNEELENIILNLTWKSYDKERIFISQQLKISEWDVVLADSKISDPKIDDKKVLNPIGFAGKTLSFCLENTYLHYYFWEAIKDILKNWGGELILCAEKNLIFDKIFSLINKGEKIAMVDIGFYSTGIGILGNYLNSFKSFNWGSENLIEIVSENLAVSFEVAKEIIDLYQRNELSNDASLWFRKLFEKELKLLVGGTALALRDAPIKENIRHIYLAGELENFPYLIETFKKQKWPPSIFSNDLDITFYSAFNLIDDLNIEIINFNNKKSSDDLIISLASIFVIENKYEEMNKILKRRIKWLNQNLLKKTN